MPESLPAIGASGWGSRLNAVLTELQGVMARSGSGSPEGVITAPVGVAYRDTDATNGAVLWVKATGTGNTGWRVAYGDTGDRAVKTLLNANWQVGGGWVMLRRAGNVVSLQVFNLNRVTALSTVTWDPVMTMPAGFRWSQPVFEAYMRYGGSAAAIALSTQDGAALSAFSNPSISAGASFNGHATWMTNDPWPTSLPGTAA